MAPTQVLRISGIRLENASGVKSLELNVGGQQHKIFHENGNDAVIQADFNPILETMSEHPISVLIKYRASFTASLLHKVVEVPLNPRDVLSQTSDNNKFRCQLSSKPGFILEISTRNALPDTERASKDFKQLEHELQQARAQIEKELMTRQVLEQQNEELGQMLKKRQHEETRELADTAEQAKEADTLRQGLAQVRALAEEVKAQEAKNTAKIAQLSDEHTTTVRNLEATHSRGEDLEAHLHLARAENEEITKLLEKERVLQAQATEHHRMLQQRISEADVNRTALELQLLTCRQERDDAIRQLKEAQSSAEQANVEARSTREKLAGLEHELRGAKEAGGSLRNLLKTSQSDLEDVTRKLKEVQSSAELERGEATGLREGLQRAEQVERSLRDELAASYASQSDSERRIEEITQQLKDAQASIGLANADAASVQEELQRLEYELKKAKLVERSLRDELKANHASQLDTERRLEDVNRQLRDVQANADVANTKALGLHEELQQVMHELKDMKSVEGSLRVDLEAIHASHRDAEKRFQDATRQLKDAQSSTKGVQEGLRRVEDTLAEARRIEHSLREELRTSRDSQSEAEQRLDEVAQRFKDVQSGAELANTEARSMKAELRRVVQELKEARRIEGMLRDNLTLTGRVSQQDFEHRFEESNWLVDQLLDVAVTFWNTHHRALQMLQSMIIAPNGQIDNLGEPGSSPNVHNGSVPQGPPSIDTADAASALQVLRGLDHDNFLDCITKVGSVIKKWQKVCKLHKERAKGKIAFRNFSKGDLALFLPTRNSKVKHWAAFNVSSPHQFLQATGHMEEQLKFREWALCRITTITERVVSRDNPGSLQYGLDDGIKYYVMEVEDWGQQTKEAKKQESSSQEVPTKLDAESLARRSSSVADLRYIPLGTRLILQSKPHQETSVSDAQNGAPPPPPSRRASSGSSS